MTDRKRTTPPLLSIGIYLLILLPAAAAWSAEEPTKTSAAESKPIRVVVWDEQQPAQKPMYDNFLGNAIADHLKKQAGFKVTSTRLDDPEQGLPDPVLNDCDVLVWWGHVRNREVTEEVGKRVARRIKDGKLSLIALHSAHWSWPFISAMSERAVEDALKSLPEEKRKSAKTERIPPKLAKVSRDDPLSPSVERKTAADGSETLVITLPSCIFPAWRADGKPSHIKTLLPDHPIAAGIPKTFDIRQTEMYDEPFHVPKPDAVIFEESWDAGEHFRSGSLWNVGKGKVFYFRPGHEIYPIYRQEIPLKIIENACRWMGTEAQSTKPEVDH